MQISVMTVMAPDYKLVDLVPLMKTIGYTAIEPAVGYKKALWDVNSQWHISIDRLEEDLKNLKKLGDANGIAICSLASGAPIADPVVLERFLAAAASVSCPCVRVGAPGYDGKTKYKEVFEQAIRNVETVEKLSQKHKVKSVFETHMFNIIPSASAAYQLVRHFDPDYVGIVYDPANGMVEGWENFGIDLLDKYIAHVHMKNLSWLPDKGGQVDYFCDGRWRWVFSGIMAGVSNWSKIIKALKAINYDHAISFEDFEGGYVKVPEGITTEEKLKRDFNDLQNLLKEA